MKKIRVVQIGIGHDHATAVLHSLLGQPELFEVVALAVPPEEGKPFEKRLAAFREVLPILTPEEALALPALDAAVIETEEGNLTKYAMEATACGLAVHMDKPGGTDPAAFSALVGLAEQKRTVLHLGYMYRYNAAVREAIERVKAGELGEIYCVEAHMDCLHTPEKRQWLDRFPGGMTFFLGCHLIDIILRIMGEPEEVIPFNMSTGIDGVTAKDFGFVLFRYRHGISFAKTCAAEPGGFARRQLVICGSRGTLELNPLEEYNEDGNLTTGVRFTDEARGRSWNDAAPVRRYAPTDRYDGMMAGFAAMVRGEVANPCDYEYERRLYRILLRACGEFSEEKKV